MNDVINMFMLKVRLECCTPVCVFVPIAALPTPRLSTIHKLNYGMELRFNDFKCIIRSNELVYLFSHRATKNRAKGEEITTTYTSLWESPVSR